MRERECDDEQGHCGEEHGRLATWMRRRRFALTGRACTVGRRLRGAGHGGVAGVAEMRGSVGVR